MTEWRGTDTIGFETPRGGATTSQGGNNDIGETKRLVYVPREGAPRAGTLHSIQRIDLWSSRIEQRGQERRTRRRTGGFGSGQRVGVVPGGHKTEIEEWKN